jgi:VanZ family protein
MRRLWPWLPALAWAALIFSLSAQPKLVIDLELGSDKVAHFLAYAVLGALLAHAVTRTGWPLALAYALGIAYGASDEIHQYFVPGRSSDVVDWVADALGVLAAVALYQWMRRRAWRDSAPLGGARTDSSSS